MLLDYIIIELVSIAHIEVNKHSYEQSRLYAL